jgi:GNAT superfamily N-acetyltransferase
LIGDDFRTMRIRDYSPGDDARSVGMLIADTFSRYNLVGLSPEIRDRLLGPFLHARSEDPAHRREILGAIRSEIVLVAEEEGEIVGVLRGRPARLGSLFVQGDRHHQGIGRALVERFEARIRDCGSRAVKVAAAPVAVPFYLKVGYKRCTGMRKMRIFGVDGYVYQPMKKDLV